MKEITSIQFTDADSGDEALVIIRASEGIISLCLSLKQNGDIEVFLRSQEYQKLLSALQEAVSTAGT